ncbi:MaoC/PaaZ C-terminal domain-containing protein [Carbonactinospora thermoautotrophica]|uniref:MaoC/PaaZ C-terminal domain-containing protein n=1 Tax=Carbonactinospora thermoautotrophica TaxID=1469144 RepID=UPI00226EA592|nr:MaoC/PaaZ C-terminal domain-containing protein [Carbonactinospora thermoautotrophica]
MTAEIEKSEKSAPYQVSGQGERFWEELSVGDRLRGPGITITDAHLVSWAGLTGDWVSLHLDEEYAARTRFGRRIAHGPLTLSLSLGLMTQTGFFGNVIAWLGLDEVRATAPVFVGDTIHPEAEVILTRPSSQGGRGVWTLAYQTLNQRGEVVMTFRSSFLVRRRPS